MPDNPSNRSQDIMDLEEKGGIPTIVQCGHILADSRKRAARARKKGDCENPHPLDVGETIVVTELAWLKRQPPYPKGVTDPAIFGDQNTTLAAQAVALKYTVANKANDVKFTGDNRSTLATGFSVRTEPCVVVESRDHPVKRGPIGRQRNYDSLYITVRSPSFPEGIQIHDRRITPEVVTKPCDGSQLMLRLVKIEPNVATMFGCELIAPAGQYPTGRLITENTEMVEYLTSGQARNKLFDGVGGHGHRYTKRDKLI